MIDKAFILAAGYGKRLRPHTSDRPKPLVEVNGLSLLEHTLDKLEQEGVRDVMINTHYLGEKIIDKLQTRTGSNLHFSHENTLLDTGGGIKNTLAFFEDKPFFVLSGDGMWDDGVDETALAQLSTAWNPETMDILMLLQKATDMKITKGVGDYHMDDDGRCNRALDKSGAYMWTSMRIHHPRIFENTPEGAFSYLGLLDTAETQGRLHGVVNKGMWHHISTPDDLEAVRTHYTGQDDS